MKTDLLPKTGKIFFLLISLLILTVQSQGQNKEEKQSPLKAIRSKLNQKILPEKNQTKSTGDKKTSSNEKQVKNGDQQSRNDPDTEEKFDEDEDDPDKMGEKMMRNLGHDPEKVKQMMNDEGSEADLKSIPEPNAKALANIKPTPRNESEMINYLKKFDDGADNVLSPEAKKDVAPHLNKGAQTKEAAYMLWMAGKQEAAAYLMMKASLSDPQDELLLCNLASVISMAGYAEKSIPILEYLKGKYPQSSIVNNNLGQAWLSLGQIQKAKTLLEQAVKAYEQHPEANRSLARIALKEKNTAEAKAHLKKALQGCFSQEAYYELKDLDPGKTVDMMEIIRLNHKRFYKGYAVTKRFKLPAVPESSEQAVKREQEIADFFHGIELTNQALSSKYPPGNNNLFNGYEQVTRQMMENSENMNNMEAVQKQYQLAGQIWTPFKIQAQEMLMAELDDSYASSFNKRFKQLQQSRDDQMKALEESMAADQKTLQSMQARLNKMESGEGEGPEVQALEKQICALRKKISELSISKSAAINNAYIQQMEELAFQRFQEQTYWNTLYHLPQDPTDLTYRLFGEYLGTMAGLKSNYPYPVPPLYTGEGCETKLPQTIIPKGKMSTWEDKHCETHWDLDFHYVKSKFTCKEVTIGAKVYGIEVGVGQKYDPSTLETVEHSLYLGGKIGKVKGDVGKTLSAQAGLGLVTTIKVDGNWQFKDFIIKGTAGAELGLKVPKSTDPNDSELDIRQAASIGASQSYEISIVSGFSNAGAKVSTVGNIFNRF